MGYDGYPVYVCFQDRRRVKLRKKYHQPVCPDCTYDMVKVNQGQKIPARGDDRGWEELAKRYRQRHYIAWNDPTYKGNRLLQSIMKRLHNGTS